MSKHELSDSERGTPEPESIETEGKVIDLMAALTASLRKEKIKLALAAAPVPHSER